MDLRSQASLMAAILSAALAANVLLRPRRRGVYYAYSFFAGSIALWYLTAFLRRVLDQPLWDVLNLACGVLVPLGAVQFFRLYGEEADRAMQLLGRAATASAVVVLGAVIALPPDSAAVRTTTFVYGVFFFSAGLLSLFRRVQGTASRLERARLRYLTLVGGLGGLFTLLDYVRYVGLEIPPVGTVLILVFLYMLLQAITRQRLLDLYELTGRLGVLTGLSFLLAAMLWGMSQLSGERFFLHTAVSALVVLLIFDPVRSKVGDFIRIVLFRERYDLERSVTGLRRRVSQAVEVDELCRVLIAGLEESRRFTHAAIYLADPDRHGFQLAGHLGPEPPARVETAPAGPLLDRMGKDHPIVLEVLERELDALRATGADREAETLFEVAKTLEALHATLCLPIASETQELYGFLALRDERVRDAFAPEEVQLLLGLAAQVAISIESSSLFEEMKERDRLLLLGEMAAGLAHEIRNPLGAIKAAAQYLAEPGHEADTGAAEFLDIIVEETDRLDRVVGSFLAFARPAQREVAAADIENAVRRTMQLLAPEIEAAGCRWSLEVDADLPPVRIDVEELRQVLINLVKNAVQAMEQAPSRSRDGAAPSGGDVRVEVATKMRAGPTGDMRPWVQLRVADTGPGIPKEMHAKLFVPFVTTKERGTGLGLAISQRIVSAAGGRIEARSTERGTTFVVQLPAVEAAPHDDAQSMGDGEPPAPSGSTSLERRDEAGAGELESGETTSR